MGIETLAAYDADLCHRCRGLGEIHVPREDIEGEVFISTVCPKCHGTGHRHLQCFRDEAAALDAKRRWKALRWWGAIAALVACAIVILALVGGKG